MGYYISVLRRQTTGKKIFPTACSSQNLGTIIMDTIHFLCVFCEPAHQKCPQHNTQNAVNSECVMIIAVSHISRIVIV